MRGVLNERDKKLGEILLISEELLKLYSPISKNVSVDKIFPFVQLAQPYFITPILGDALTRQLQEQILDDNLTDENKALVVKVAMPLAMWSTYLAVRALGYTFSQKGLTKERSENSEALNDREMGEFILSIKNQAEMATELLIKYLCKCKDLYPKWSPENECDCQKYQSTNGSTRNQLKNLVYFPNKRFRGGCYCSEDFWIVDKN